MAIKVPAGWTSQRLKEIVKPVKRKTDGKSHPVMTISSKSGFLLQSDKYSRDMAGKSVKKYTLIRKGEFAYNKGNSKTYPQGCVFRLPVNSALVPNVYISFDLVKAALPEYASYLFESGALNREIAKYINSGVRNNGLLNLSASDFYSAKVLLPPIHEQKAITNALISYDNAVDATNKAIVNSKRAKQETMRRLFTLGVNNNSRLKPIAQKWVLGRVTENITHIPADWSLVRLTSVAKLESGHTPSRKKPEYWTDGDIPWISLQDAEGLDSVQISATNECINQLGIDNSSARLLPKDTVVLQRTANIGLSSRLGRQMCTSQHFANWVCGDKLHPGYLVQVFKHMKREWKRLQAGSVLPDIYMITFKKLQILLPPLDEQIKIAEIGEAFDRRIEAEKEYLTELKKVKQGLAHELLSGRVRLPQSMIDSFKKGSDTIAESAV